MQPDTAVIEVTVAASAGTVWVALREPELIRRWHGWNVDGLAEEVRTIYLNGVVEDPDTRTLEITGGDRFTLHEVPGGTTVRIERAPEGSDPDWADDYDDITRGWWTFLQQLRFAVERHALAERRTVVLDGASVEVSVPAPVGAAYRAAFGEELSGTVGARRPGQLALTVDGWGAGLLGDTRQPDGGTQLVLTTYGLDDDAFDALEARWGTWWEKHDPLP
jgi:hypothetical protein